MTISNDLSFEKRAKLLIHAIISAEAEYGVTLSHENTQGSFLVVDGIQDDIVAWMQDYGLVEPGKDTRFVTEELDIPKEKGGHHQHSISLLDSEPGDGSDAADYNEP